MGTKKNKLDNVLLPWQRVINYIFLGIIFLSMALPMWNVIVISTSTAAYSNQAGMKLWWNGGFSIEGFKYVFGISKLGRPFLNSSYVSIVSTLIQVILSSLAGYILIQKELPFKKAITSFILLTMMIPGDLTMISIYQLNRQLNLINTYTGLIVNGLVSGFCIMLMRNYFLSVPYSLAESSRLDGASEFKIFWSVYMPVSLPGVATISFLEFVGKWNTIMIPATITTDPNYHTLPITLRNLILNSASIAGQAPPPDNAIMAAIVISVMPMMVFYVFAQKFLLSGMTLGASKE